MKKAIDSFQQNMGAEFTAFDLKEASIALEEIIGKITNDDILNNIFRNFCVGK
jgi:tRNA modification GTPase